MISPLLNFSAGIDKGLNGGGIYVGPIIEAEISKRTQEIVIIKHTLMRSPKRWHVKWVSVR